MTAHYLLHGMVVDSSLPLEARRVSDLVPARLVVRSGPSSPVPDDAPPGRVVAQLVTAERPWYTVSQADGFRLRFHRTADVDVSADLRDVACRADPSSPPDVASVLVAGTVLAFVNVVLGRLVLHASTVEVDGRAIAVIGHSGMGKSTTAAMLCLVGARLVGDDVLVVDPDTLACHPGTSALRLRDRARDLGDSVAGSGRVRRTPDGRHAVCPRLAKQQEVPLSLVVVPHPRRDLSRPYATTLAPAEALLMLLRFPRIAGLVPHGAQQQFFDGAAALARRVRVVRLDVPWATRPDSRLASAVWTTVMDVHRHTTRARPTVGDNGQVPLIASHRSP